MPNGSFTLERTLILPRGKYDPLKIDIASLKGAPILVKMGPKTQPLVVGCIRDVFENPREGIYADIMISSTIEVEVDADGRIVGTFLNPGP